MARPRSTLLLLALLSAVVALLPRCAVASIADAAARRRISDGAVLFETFDDEYSWEQKWVHSKNPTYTGRFVSDVPDGWKDTGIMASTVYMPGGGLAPRARPPVCVDWGSARAQALALARVGAPAAQAVLADLAVRRWAPGSWSVARAVSSSACGPFGTFQRFQERKGSLCVRVGGWGPGGGGEARPWASAQCTAWEACMRLHSSALRPMLACVFSKRGPGPCRPPQLACIRPRTHMRCSTTPPRRAHAADKRIPRMRRRRVMPTRTHARTHATPSDVREEPALRPDSAAGVAGAAALQVRGPRVGAAGRAVRGPLHRRPDLRGCIPQAADAGG